MAKSASTSEVQKPNQPDVTALAKEIFLRSVRAGIKPSSEDSYLALESFRLAEVFYNVRDSREGSE